MQLTVRQALVANFLGGSPDWYKFTVVAFLLLNPVVALSLGMFAAGWLLIAEFIFVLAMALRCYPLQPGGLLAIEAVLIGMTTPDGVYRETLHNFPVILLLIFVVAGIHFLREILLYVFSRILLGVQSKPLLGLMFCAAGAFLSAFLDALTVTAMVIAVAEGFYRIYQRVASGQSDAQADGWIDDGSVPELDRQDLDQFRGFLAGAGSRAAGLCRARDHTPVWIWRRAESCGARRAE